jgi:branched-chain amino acid transport system substrate-binding protein
VKQGGDSWFFITADYAFGHALERDTGDAVKGEVSYFGRLSRT